MPKGITLIYSLLTKFWWQGYTAQNKDNICFNDKKIWIKTLRRLKTALHAYEIDQKSVALILRTYASVFEHMSVWFADGPDILLLGFESSDRMLDAARLVRRAERADFAAGLARAGLGAPDALLVHELWPAGVAHAALAPGPLHSLDHPRLSDWAARAFHVGKATRR